MKLSKLTFEELVELKTDDSLKYAHQIYEQEDKKLKSLHEEREHLLKNVEFYKKVDEEIKEKEKKLAENIKTVEDETASAKKRADKYILYYLDKFSRARPLLWLRLLRSCWK